jgi:hypothetical protein
MGEGVLGHISKGVIHTKVDALVNSKVGSQFDKRADFLKALVTEAHTADDYRAILEKQAGITVGESNYLRDTWYDTSASGWWPKLQPIYPILRQGLIKALREAGDKLPLDSYWLPMGSDTGVEVIVCRSLQQVTRIILTPITPVPERPRSTLAPMWAIKRADGSEQVTPERLDAVVEAMDGNVVTWRVKEFP